MCIRLPAAALSTWELNLTTSFFLKKLKNNSDHKLNQPVTSEKVIEVLVQMFFLKRCLEHWGKFAGAVLKTSLMYRGKFALALFECREKLF